MNEKFYVSFSKSLTPFQMALDLYELYLWKVFLFDNISVFQPVTMLLAQEQRLGKEIKYLIVVVFNLVSKEKGIFPQML